jgi:hypothetical protein
MVRLIARAVVTALARQVFTRTQPEPVLLELRTGAARMLLAAEAGVPRTEAMPSAISTSSGAASRSAAAAATSLSRTRPDAT